MIQLIHPHLILMFRIRKEDPGIDSQDDREFSLNNIMIDGKQIFFSAYSTRGPSLLRYDPDSCTMTKEKSLCEPLVMSFRSNSDLIGVTEKDVLFNDRKIYTTKTRFTGYMDFLPDSDLLLFSTRNNLVMLDTKTGDNQRMRSDLDSTDVYNDQDGSIGILAGLENGVAYFHFPCKEDLFKGRPSDNVRFTDDEFKGLSRAWIQDSHVIYIAKKPNHFFVGYHENGKYVVKTLAIDKFDSIDGSVQKNVL